MKWSQFAGASALHVHGRPMILTGTPTPSWWRPPHTTASSLSRVDGAPCSAVSHAVEGPEATLCMRATFPRPQSVSVSKPSRNSAATRSSSARETVFCTKGTVCDGAVLRAPITLASHAVKDAVPELLKRCTCGASERVAGRITPLQGGVRHRHAGDQSGISLKGCDVAEA